MAEIIRLSDVSPDDFPLYWFDIAREDHFWFKARFRAFLSLAKKCNLDFSKPLNALEIGCGNGLVRKQLETISSWKVDGSDIQVEALKENPDLRGKTYLYNIHDRRQDMEAAYDVVILFDVLEHIPDTLHFLQSALFHLKPGGQLFINVPALDSLKGQYDKVVGHIRRYDKKMMATEFKSLSVEIAEQRYWAMPLVPLLWLREKITPKNLSTEEVVRRGMQPPSAMMNQLMDITLGIGHTLLPSPPIGASLLTCVRKIADGTKESQT